jgi:hypothetical protein
MFKNGRGTQLARRIDFKPLFADMMKGEDLAFRDSKLIAEGQIIKRQTGKSQC